MAFPLIPPEAWRARGAPGCAVVAVSCSGSLALRVELSFCIFICFGEGAFVSAVGRRARLGVHHPGVQANETSWLTLYWNRCKLTRDLDTASMIELGPPYVSLDQRA